MDDLKMKAKLAAIKQLIDELDDSEAAPFMPKEEAPPMEMGAEMPAEMSAEGGADEGMPMPEGEDEESLKLKLAALLK